MGGLSRQDVALRAGVDSDYVDRLVELGIMYRYERSGVFSGLSRVRAMMLNDVYIFCLLEQI